MREDSDVLAGIFTKFEYAGTERFYAGQDNYINFSPDSDEDSTLIYRQAVQASANVEKNVVALQFSFCPKEIKGNKKFEVRFGLSRLSDNSDSPDSYAVRFSQKDGDLYYSVEYNCQPDGYENASTVLKVEEKLLPYAPGEDWQVKIEQDYNGFMRIYFDGELYSSVYGLPVPNGYIGFMQSGGTTNDDNYIDVNLDNIKVTNRYDERPENTNIDLDFETGDMNLNEWQISSNARYGRIGGVYVADGVLHFDNVGNDSKIVTKHRYANFEMTFDIVDLRREAVIDDFGNKLYPVSSVFGIMFGIETYAATFMSMYMQSPILSFQTSIDADTWEKDGGTSVTLYGSDSNDPGTVLPDKYDFFDKNNAGKTINVSVSLIDSHLILKIKYSDESEWYTVYEKDFSKSYVGYIAIWGMGAGSEADQISCGQFTLDNLKITNKDSSPNLIEVPFESNRPTPPGDYVYIDRNDDDEFLIENMEIPKE